MFYKRFVAIKIAVFSNNQVENKLLISLLSS